MKDSDMADVDDRDSRDSNETQTSQLQLLKARWLVSDEYRTGRDEMLQDNEYIAALHASADFHFRMPNEINNGWKIAEKRVCLRHSF